MTPGLNHYDLWAGLLGGLALFLFGLDILTKALKALAGGRLKGTLAKLTANRFVGVGTGAAVTAVIQSSSVTTVLMVGLVSAGLMSMTQSVSVIMGANIGTTVTAQILAFKVTKIALPMVAAGFSMWFLSKNEKIRRYGGMVLGVGLVFYGMGVMSDAMAPLRSYPPFLDFIAAVDNRYLSVLIGLAFTAIIQSSSATTGIVIVMAGQGLMDLPMAIAVILGANVGTCVTAALAAIGKPREAVRAAAVHVLFNIAGVLLWLWFIPELAEAARVLSPEGAVPRQIANAHTLFNVANTFVFIWFNVQIAQFVEWLIPDKPMEDGVIRPKYLDRSLISTPSMALEQVRLETRRLANRVNDMFGAVLPAVLSGSPQDLKAVRRMDEDVDALHGHIIEYLRLIGMGDLSSEETEEFVSLMQVANDYEHAGDVIETDLVTIGLHRLDENVTVSEATDKVIRKMHGAVGDALDTAIEAVSGRDSALAARVISMKGRINRLARAAAAHCAERLIANEPDRLKAYVRETEIIEKFKHLYTLARRIAKTVKSGENAEEAEDKAEAEA